MQTPGNFPGVLFDKISTGERRYENKRCRNFVNSIFIFTENLLELII